MQDEQQDGISHTTSATRQDNRGRGQPYGTGVHKFVASDRHMQEALDATLRELEIMHKQVGALRGCQNVKRNRCQEDKGTPPPPCVVGTYTASRHLHVATPSNGRRDEAAYH